MKKLYTDQEIIDGLLQGGKGEHAFLKQLYRENQTTILAFIQENNGSLEEAKDVFQEGILILYKQLKAQKFRGESQLNTYLFSICRYLWYHKLKKESRRADLLAQQEDLPSPSHIDPYRRMQDEEQRALMMALFQQIGDKCRQVLLYSLYYDYAMKEIAEEMGFKSDQIARNKKHRCLGRLKKVLAEKPLARSIIRGQH